MTTTPNQNRRKGVRIEIKHVVKHCVEVAFVKVTTKRLTTEAATEEGVSKALQLVWYLSTQIALGNLNVHK